MVQSKRISIYFCDSGGGHRSAAEAIKAGIESVAAQESPDLNLQIISQPIVDQSCALNRHLVAFYNYLARHHTTWIKYYYHFLHLIRSESKIYYGLYRSYMHDLLRTQQPSLIVSVHPMICEALATARAELGMDTSVKLAVVITDPNQWLWKAWACKRADLIIAANEVVRRQLLAWGIEPAKIQVLGMPVHPSFLAPPAVPRAQFLCGLGLSPDLFTVCINAGWAGNAHLLDTYTALANCQRQIQAIFLSGYNQELHKKALEQALETGIPTVVLPFHDQMSDLMGAVDLMVTKTGGLTTFQALARRLPLVMDNTIEPMPQESPTMEMLCLAGIARKLNKPAEICEIVDSMRFRSQELEALPEDYQLNLTDQAIFDIARSLLTLTDATILSEPSIQAEDVKEVA